MMLVVYMHVRTYSHACMWTERRGPIVTTPPHYLRGREEGGFGEQSED